MAIYAILSCSIAEDVDEIIGRLGSLEAEDQFIQRGWFTNYLVFSYFSRDVWLSRTCHSEICKCLGSQWARSVYSILNNGLRKHFLFLLQGTKPLELFVCREEVSTLE